MKENKWLKIIIIILLVIIIGLLIYLIVDKKKSSEDIYSVNQEDLDASPESLNEVSTDATDTDGDSVTVVSDEKKDTSKEDYRKYACYAEIRTGSSWQDKDKYIYQFEVDVRNQSKEDIKDWEVRLEDFAGTEMKDGWNAEYNLKEKTLYCTPMDYNNTIPAGQTVNFGFQAAFQSDDMGKAEKKAVLYINGKKYEKEKEEVTTQSKEEKEESKKEKKALEKGTPLENHGALQVKGTDIVDKNGDKYQLKGISTHGLAWFPEYVNKDSFKTLRDDWGANLIRLAMYTAESGGYCQDGDKDKLKSLVESGVDYASELGMYVIIDWHILSDNNPKINQDEAVSFFDEMSAKYSDYDNVLYEICNEPNGGTTWSEIKEYAEEVIPVIRANDKDAIIIVGTPTWSQDVDIAAEDPIKDSENIMYTVHFYAATHKDNIRNKVKTARDKGLAVFISEFSICDASGNGGVDYDSADEWMKLINDYNLSYAGWNLSNKSETSALISPGCDKTSDWNDSDLSETGKWLKDTIGR